MHGFEHAKFRLDNFYYSLQAVLDTMMWCRLTRKPLKPTPRLVQLQTVAVDMVSKKCVRSAA